MDKNTRRVRIYAAASFFALLFCGTCVPLARAVDFAQLEIELRSTITNRAVTDEVLLQAISRLGKVSEPPDFWTRIANDSSYTLTHRRRCIFALVRRHGMSCTSIEPLARRLTPATWLRDEDIELVTHVFGWIPIDFTLEDSVFRIRVLPDPGRRS